MAGRRASEERALELTFPAILHAESKNLTQHLPKSFGNSEVGLSQPFLCELFIWHKPLKLPSHDKEMKKQGKEECAALLFGAGKGGLGLPCSILCLPAGLSEVLAAPSLAILCKKQALNANNWPKPPEKLNLNWSVVSQQPKNQFFPQENKCLSKIILPSYSHKSSYTSLLWCSLIKEILFQLII